MKKIIILLLPLFIAGCLSQTASVDDNVPANQIVEESLIINDEENKMPEIKYDYFGELVDVTGGQAAGVAQAGFIAGEYNLLAEFDQLPELQGTDFYEGWVVRQQPFDFISTGKLIKQGENDVNIYSDLRDLTDYNFYVLTLEPDDGDPAPAEHILEGTMSLK